MRYGKKLALCLQEEANSSKPFISHKVWREILSRTVKEHRSGCEPNIIEKLDGEFLLALKSDNDIISAFCRQVENEHLKSLEELIVRAQSAGVTAEGPVARLAVEIHRSLTDANYKGLQNTSAASLRSLWSELASSVSSVCNSFNDLAWKWQQHLNYLEVNIAGYRKTIKQRGKQIPIGNTLHKFTDYMHLTEVPISIQSKFTALHSQLEPCLKQFAPGAELFIPKIGSEILDANEKIKVDPDLIKLLLSLLPRE